jgi:hypothetical protein
MEEINEVDEMMMGALGGDGGAGFHNVDMELTSEFSSRHSGFKPPKFISEVTEKAGYLFECYFNWELTQWHRFSVDRELTSSVVGFH